MPDQPDDITGLRAVSYALEDLPETVAFPQRAGDEPHELDVQSRHLMDWIDDESIRL